MDFLLLYKIPALLIGITIHEFFHAWSAHKLGDDTAKEAGRLTLNPIAHIDPVGAICLFLANFGWAKPVPVNPMLFRNPRRDDIIVSAAGIMANLVMAVICGIALRVLFYTGAIASGFLEPLVYILVFCVVINVVLAVFNLLPIPPLDGSHILKGLLPLELAYSFAKFETVAILVLPAVILLDVIMGIGIIGHIINLPVSAITRIIVGSDVL